MLMKRMRGMKTGQLKSLDSRFLLFAYSKSVSVSRGSGSFLYDCEGKRYIDLISGVATCPVGHSNKAVVRAITSQAKKILNPSNLYYSEPQVLLAKELCALSGLSKVFFSNSGTEANECAIKLARLATGKPKIICAENSFHGRTFGSLSATWDLAYKKPFEPLVPGFEFVPYGDVSELEKALDSSTAAVMLEPIQGEAGIIVPPKGYLRSVANLCSRKGILLIMDEIQSGNGRTGKFFCYQHEGIKPDIVTLAKGLANGVPIGATIARNGIDFKPKEHGSTFGGNALACSAALATIGEIRKAIPGIARKERHFKSLLLSLVPEFFSEVRGKGLMLGAELRTELQGTATAQIVSECASNGLLINCCHKKTLRFLPPLTITEQELSKAFSILKSILMKHSKN